MRLVEILARELKEWPESFGDVLGQRCDGTLHGYNDAGSVTWIGETPQLTRCDNYMHDIVTRAQWQEAREALSKPAKPGAPMPPISEAPKDATHWDPGLKCSPSWMWQQVDGSWCWHPVKGAPIEAGWRAANVDGGQMASLIKIERQWSGEGLPPVGTVCDLIVKIDGKTTPVKILAHVTDDPRFNPIAIYMPTDDPSAIVGQSVASRFRPIRTPEQIAAEERSAALAEMQKALDCGKHGPQITLQNTLMNLYDAGYRKVKDGNQEA